MSAETLQAALHGLGFAAAVEAHERLAVIRPADGGDARAIANARAEVVALAGAHGFRDVALAVDGLTERAVVVRGDAAVSGD